MQRIEISFEKHGEDSEVFTARIYDLVSALLSFMLELDSDELDTFLVYLDSYISDMRTRYQSQEIELFIQ